MGTKDDITLYMHALGFPAEVPFKGLTGKRKWRWDWAAHGVAVEYHGIGVGHQGVAGSWRDHEKVTEGQLCGWIVIQCNAGSVRDGRCFNWIERALVGAPAKRRGAGGESSSNAPADRNQSDGGVRGKLSGASRPATTAGKSGRNAKTRRRTAKDSG